MIEQELQKASEETVDAGTVVETQPAPAPAPQMNRAERRAALRAQTTQQTEQRQVKPGMFRTEVEDRAHNPIRVQLCKDWIDFFNTTCTTTAADAVKRRTATTGMASMFTSLNVLNREDTHTVLKYLTGVIESTNTGAFERRIVFANMKFLDGDSREMFHRMIDLMVAYATTEEKSAIRRRTDPTYAVAMYRDSTTRKNIDSFFPALA